ncbi:DUF1540 domain-containing protein [Desulfotomaculum copahuensis]|uniref:DUF1540 domain-containing protein n=1 Tax=Desulfotomaculum copahuensis TaxID=1838280 RepID=UPI00098F2F1E|nr:DUF1540 domain-containing protein [Desulfotomaculum copahuensis]
MSRVSKCHIEECVHNSNKECLADGGIEVRSSVMNKQASQSEHTCCDTFAPKA